MSSSGHEQHRRALRRISLEPNVVPPARTSASCAPHQMDELKGASTGSTTRSPARSSTGACRQPHRGPRPRQHHAVLADRYRCLGRPVVLGELRSRRCRDRGCPDSSGGLAPGRLHHVPRRDLADPAQLGRAVVHNRHLLQRGRQGRALRRLGGAGAVRDRDPGGVQVTTLIQREVDAAAAAR